MNSRLDGLRKILVPICLYCLNCTKFDPLIFNKIIKIVATRCQTLRLKCSKFDFGWGCARDPAGGAYSAPPGPLVGFKGIYFHVQGGKWKGKEWTGREGREVRDGKGGEQISEILNTPLFATGGLAVFAGGCVGLLP